MRRMIECAANTGDTNMRTLQWVVYGFLAIAIAAFVGNCLGGWSINGHF